MASQLMLPDDVSCALVAAAVDAAASPASPSIICLDMASLGGFVAWKRHLHALGAAPSPAAAAARRVRCVLVHRSEGWRVQAVPVTPASTDNRMQFPASWWGLRLRTLCAVTGIPGCLFVHEAGHLAASDSEAGARALALAALAAPCNEEEEEGVGAASVGADGGVGRALGEDRVAILRARLAQGRRRRRGSERGGVGTGDGCGSGYGYDSGSGTRGSGISGGGISGSECGSSGSGSGSGSGRGRGSGSGNERSAIGRELCQTSSSTAAQPAQQRHNCHRTASATTTTTAVVGLCIDEASLCHSLGRALFDRSDVDEAIQVLEQGCQAASAASNALADDEAAQEKQEAGKEGAMTPLGGRPLLGTEKELQEGREKEVEGLDVEMVAEMTRSRRTQVDRMMDDCESDLARALEVACRHDSAIELIDRRRSLGIFAPILKDK